jgi:hypothetical protein
MAREKVDAIRKFLLERADKEHTGLIKAAMDEFGISRPTASRHIQYLVDNAMLEAEGPPRARRYSLAISGGRVVELPMGEVRDENLIWRTHLRQHVQDLPKNVVDILQHGATEMINNVIDHSEASTLKVFYGRTALDSEIFVVDDGVGVFEKVKRACELEDTRHALLEISKGKLTTDPDKHSGEGLFFTSRMFTRFVLNSRGLAFMRKMGTDDAWLMEVDDSVALLSGTSVAMKIRHDAKHTAADIFRRFEEGDDAPGFAKTHVPVRLARYDNEQLVSRSQARRVLARFERFAEVMLDFEGVPQIGQAFADEIFRVFALEHPDVDIIPIHMTPEVERMYNRIQAHKFWSDQAGKPTRA